MSRTFAYCRCSKKEQTTENQILAIANNGYKIETSRVVEETISGSIEAFKRPNFSNLVTNKMESGDTLVVLKLDRLGRDNIDVQTTVNKLTDMGIKLVCLDLPVSDLSKPEGKMMFQMFATFAEFERNRIIERTNEGLDRAKKEGKILGRPTASKTTDKVLRLKGEGMTQQAVADSMDITTRTVKRHWNK